MKSNTTTTGDCRLSAGSIFCQLRQLAVQVERDIESLQTVLGSKTARDGGDRKAVNVLLHTKKDIVDLRDEVKIHLVAFSRENAKIDRVHELVNHVLALQLQNLGKVESHFQKYGYKKPVSASETNIQNSVAATSDGGKMKCDVNITHEESEDSDTNVFCELTDNVDVVSPTPPCQAACDKPEDCNMMRTPKLEDLYSHLSEETIFLIKRGVRSTFHELPLKQNTALKAYSNISFLKTPEPPVLLTGVFTLNNNTGKFPALKSNDYTPGTPNLHTTGMNVSNFSSRKIDDDDCASSKNTADVAACQVRAPQMPTLLMRKCQLSSAVSPAHTVIGRSARSFFHTPPTPDLKTCQLRRNALAHCFNASSEKNVHMSKTAGHSTPEVPKLLSVTCLSTPEVPKLFSANCLSTPEVPKLFSATCLSTPEVPKLQTCDHNFSHYLKKPVDYMKK